MIKTSQSSGEIGSIAVSIVSHGHYPLLPSLMENLSAYPEISTVILTRNIPEPDIAFESPFHLIVIDNSQPKGFGANHNAAYREARTPYFLVLNPDIRIMRNPFPVLLDCLRNDRVSLCAPAVVNSAGGLEDSVRRFPSLSGLAMKALGWHDGRLRYEVGDAPLAAPWVAGMFMLFRSKDYADMGGFDEKFYLYYEDVDLCARLWRSGRKVMLCPEVDVEHDARRASHRDPRHMLWHLTSIIRYFRKYPLRPGPPLP